MNKLLKMYEIENRIKKYKIIKHSKGSSMSGKSLELTEKEQKGILKKVLG